MKNRLLLLISALTMAMPVTAQTRLLLTLQPQQFRWQFSAVLLLAVVAVF